MKNLIYKIKYLLFLSWDWEGGVGLGGVVFDWEGWCLTQPEG
jgi:hypothetical protein